MTSTDTHKWAKSFANSEEVFRMKDVTGLRVLVVEDEALIRWSISETLGTAGHDVIEAVDAASAREALRTVSEPIDVVLLDFRLPDSSDLALLADIRRLAPGSAVVMMTAYGTPEVQAGALNLGAYSVISKPFDIAALDPLVRDAYLSAR